MRGKLQIAGIVVLAVLAGALAEPVFAQRGRGQAKKAQREARKEQKREQQEAKQQQTTQPQSPAQTPPAGQPQGAGGQSGPGKNFVPGGARRAGGPAVPPQFMERLRQMTPADQERFLNNHARFNNLPPERQEQIRQNLRHWNSLTPDQQREMRDREDRWGRMSPEQQRHIREEILPKWKNLDPARRQPIMRRLRALRGMTDEEREARLKDEAFLSGLSTEDREMLRELARLRIGGPQESPQDNPPLE